MGDVLCSIGLCYMFGCALVGYAISLIDEVKNTYTHAHTSIYTRTPRVNHIYMIVGVSKKMGDQGGDDYIPSKLSRIAIIHAGLQGTLGFARSSVCMLGAESAEHSESEIRAHKNDRLHLLHLDRHVRLSVV